jgi:hypothetical protein
MTRREWNTEDGWEVACGWDRPLQHFFIDISRKCRNCDGQGGFGEEPNDADQCPVCEGQGTEYLFNNLTDNTGMTDRMGGMTIEQVKQVMEKYLTKYQEGILGALILDEVGNVGNLVQHYEPYGMEKIE